MVKVFNGLFLLTGTFGISAATAAAIYSVLAKYGTQLTVGRLVALIGATGGTALAVAAIVGLGGVYLLSKLKAGKKSFTAW
ncbi:MAG: hypothetical protein LBC17_01035 [Lactobacillaceae bacterium]|jgi:hypothetical protein|nr:hypothetical protein [Lactobacillaceae bacterium]